MEVIQNILRYHKYHANFNCLNLEIGLCNLFPILLECITILDDSFTKLLCSYAVGNYLVKYSAAE